MSLTPELGRQRQEGHEFKVSLSYLVSLFSKIYFHGKAGLYPEVYISENQHKAFFVQSPAIVSSLFAWFF